MSESNSDRSGTILAAKISVVGVIAAAFIAVIGPAVLSRSPAPVPPTPTVIDGGGGHSTPTPTTFVPTPAPATPSAVSIADWRRNANAICGGALANLNALGPAQDMDEYVSKGIVAIRVTQSLADQVRELETPSTHAADIDEWLSHLDAMVLSHSRAIDAAQRGDQGSVGEAATELAAELERANDAARVLGLSCIFVNS